MTTNTRFPPEEELFISRTPTKSCWNDWDRWSTQTRDTVAYVMSTFQHRGLNLYINYKNTFSEFSHKLPQLPYLAGFADTYVRCGAVLNANALSTEEPTEKYTGEYYKSKGRKFDGYHRAYQATTTALNDLINGWGTDAVSIVSLQAGNTKLPRTGGALVQAEFVKSNVYFDIRYASWKTYGTKRRPAYPREEDWLTRIQKELEVK